MIIFAYNLTVYKYSSDTVVESVELRQLLICTNSGRLFFHGVGEVVSCAADLLLKWSAAMTRQH